MGKYPPQSEAEMGAEMLKARSTSKIYKVQSDEHRADVTKTLVARRAMELSDAPNKKIELGDTEAVKAQTLLYLKCCSDTGSIPSFMGLARALGFSRRALYDEIEQRRNPATAQWLELARDTFSDILAESALTNSCNSVFAIFCQKAQYQWRESIEIVARPAEPLGATPQDVSNIAERYAASLPATGEDG